MKLGFATCLVLAIVLLSAAGAQAQPWTGCQAQDTIFVLDSSGSIMLPGWTDLKNQVATAIRGYDPINADVRLGVIRFSTSVVLDWSFSYDQTRETMALAVESLSFMDGLTHTRDAIQTAIDVFDLESPVERQKFIILITDGPPNPFAEQDPCVLAGELASRGITLLVVGIGDSWVSTYVECLVDDPATQMIHVQEFTEITGAIGTFSSTFCTEPVPVEGLSWGGVKSRF